ncbi:MAG: hypothetical protein AB7K24_26725 [Gemmataceae bacterium]
MEPAAHSFLPPDGASLLSQDEERRLKRIFGIWTGAEHARAGRQHHRSVPGQQLGESGLVTVVGKSSQQLSIRGRTAVFRAGRPTQKTDDIAQLSAAHARDLLASTFHSPSSPVSSSILEKVLPASRTVRPTRPWVNYLELLERQRCYDPVLFKNECLGLPTVLGEHVVTRAELEACCQVCPMARSCDDVPHQHRDYVVAGVDWGGGVRAQTSLTLGYMDRDYRFVVARFERFRATEEPDVVIRQIAERCRTFGAQFIAADGGGNGHVYNRLLAKELDFQCHLHAIMYSTSEQEPHQEGILWRWTVGRSASIGVLFQRVKAKSLLFPRVEECGSFLDEIACEVAEYDKFQRSIKFTHPETQPDDCLHATNYALLMGIRLQAGRVCL